MSLLGSVRRVIGLRPLVGASPRLYAVDERLPDCPVADTNLLVYRDRSTPADDAVVLRCDESRTFAADVDVRTHGELPLEMPDRRIQTRLIQPDTGSEPAPDWLRGRSFDPTQPPDSLDDRIAALIDGG